MLGSASRITIRSVSADFWAVAGTAPAPSSTTARIAAPSLFCIRMSPSIIRVLRCQRRGFGVKHALCQMTFYHPLRRPDHARWCLMAAAFDRDAAARVEPAARRNIGRIRHDIAEADIRHALARLRRQYALQQRLRVGMPGAAKQRVSFVALDKAAEIHHRNFARDMFHDREIVADEE